MGVLPLAVICCLKQGHPKTQHWSTAKLGKYTFSFSNAVLKPMLIQEGKLGQV